MVLEFCSRVCLLDSFLKWSGCSPLLACPASEEEVGPAEPAVSSVLFLISCLQLSLRIQQESLSAGGHHQGSAVFCQPPLRLGSHILAGGPTVSPVRYSQISQPLLPPSQPPLLQWVHSAPPASFFSRPLSFISFIHTKVIYHWECTVSSFLFHPHISEKMFKI